MSSAAKVGIFMLAILAVLAFLILRIEDISMDRGMETREINVVFDSVAGLDEKSPVRVAGVRVGKVTRIRLTDGGRAIVTLEVDRNVELRRGASAAIASLGLLGEKYVELIPGPPNAPVLQLTEKDVLEGHATPTFDEVTDQVSSIADDIKAITAALRSVIADEEGEQRLEEIVLNIHDVTSRLRLLIAANEGNVNATAENLRAITADLRVEIPRIAASIDRVARTMEGTVGDNREDVRVIVQNLRSLSRDLQTTTDNLNAITGHVKSGEGTVGKLLYSDEAHQRLTSALSSVEGGVNELRNTLGRVGKMQLDLGIESAYYTGLDDSTLGITRNSRTAVTANLVPDPEKNRYYRFGISEDPWADRDEKIIETTVRGPNGAETTTVTRQVRYDSDYAINAQAAWRFDDLAIRIGLFDSSGGVGADYQANDRVSVTGEVFDFSGDRFDNPRLRVIGRYTFRKEKERSPALFLSTGVDNILNDAAFTFGGGIRWNDEDLKYLLGSLPTN